MIVNIAKTSSLPTYNKELMALQKRFDTIKASTWIFLCSGQTIFQQKTVKINF